MKRETERNSIGESKVGKLISIMNNGNKFSYSINTTLAAIKLGGSFVEWNRCKNTLVNDAITAGRTSVYFYLRGKIVMFIFFLELN